MDTRQAMQLAIRLRDARPSSNEGALALAAWRRVLHAIDKDGILHPDDRKAFHLVAGTDDE